MHDCKIRPNAVRLTVRGELVEPPSIHQEPFDKLRANGIFLKRTVLRLAPFPAFLNDLETE